MNKKSKIFFLIPFTLTASVLIYSWAIFLTSPVFAILPHYLGLVLFVPIVYVLFTDRTFKKAIVLTGLYLILAIINLISFFPFVMTNAFRFTIGSVEFWTPSFNIFAFALFILYGSLNFGNLSEIYLDYKEARGQL